MDRSRWRFMLMLLCLLLVAPVMPPPAAAQSPIDGKPTLGDPYFPKLGNSGYDVQHYDITLRINPKRKRISGTTVITLTPTAPLRSFTLDFIGYRISEVTVNGVEAGHSRRDNKLRITPETPLAEGAEATVEIAYGGKSATPSKYSGWLWFKRGGALLSSQPSGARTLFPSNDHPSDKATFHYDLTTPDGLTSVANGLPTEEQAPAGWQRVTWSEAAPYPTYAALVAVGNFRLVESTGPTGVPILNALPAKHVPRLERRLKNQGRIVQVLEERFGPYPYGSIGAIVVPLTSPDAMEAATRPTYPGIKWARKGRDFEQTVAHEIAHMWLGNSVTGANWRNIWLNEGFATYGELIWIAHKRKVPIGALFRKDSNVFTYASSMDNVKPGNPGRDRIWSYSVYNRGAMTLEALRRTVGDDDFNTIMRRWVSEYGIGNPAGDGTANTRNFIDLAEEVSGRDLDKFFNRWLYKRDLPRLPKDRTKSTLEAGDVSDRLRDLPRVGPDKGGVIDKLEDVPDER